MFKRGQATVYIALGLVIVVIIGVLLYLMFRQSESKIDVNTLRQQSENIKVLIKNCFEQNFLQALYIAGLQGGYVKVNENSVNINNDLSVSYGYYEGQNLLVDYEKFSFEVTNYLNFAVEKCADFSIYKEFDVQKTSDARSRIDIFDDKVNGRLSYPIKVSKNNEIITYDELYTIDYNIRLGKILKTAKAIVESEKRNPDYIDLAYLTDSDLDIKIYDIEVNKNLYVITDDQSVVNGVKYVFEFANKF